MDPELIEFVKWAGYLGFMISVLLESGVIPLFFMPSDSLLIATGFVASQGHLNIWLVNLVCFIGSVLGYMLGYSVGNKLGPKVFREQNQKFLTKEHLDKARSFYDKHAAWALVLARFFPVRALVSSMAGASNMPYGKFMFYNMLGGALWTLSLCKAGYYFGKMISPEQMDSFFLLILVCFIITVSLIPIALKYLKYRMEKNKG